MAYSYLKDIKIELLYVQLDNFFEIQGLCITRHISYSRQFLIIVFREYFYFLKLLAVFIQILAKFVEPSECIIFIFTVSRNCDISSTLF